MYSTRNPFQAALILLFLILVTAFSGNAQKIWTLEDCINYALENNLDIKKQVQTVQSTKASLLQSQLNLLPSINAGGSNVWNFGQTINQFTNTFASSKTLNENFYLQADLTIFGGLQKFNSIKQGQIDLMAGKYDLDVMKNSISLAVAGFYLDILFNSELLDVAKSQLATTKDQVARIAKMVDAGSAAKGDLLTIQAQQATEELQVVNAQNALNISYLSLQQLIDSPVDPNFVIEKPNLKLIKPPTEAITAEYIYEKALAVRPEIKSAELQVQSKQKQLAIARSGYSPVLSFGGSWGTGYSAASKQPDPNIPPFIRMDTIGITTVSNDYVVAPSYSYTYQPVPFQDQLHNNENKSLGLYLNIPIFNGWQVQNAVSQAKIQQNIADLNLESAKRDLRKKIEQAYADAVAALKKYNTSLEKVNAQEESFKYTSQKFDVGVLTSFDYNNSKKDLTAAQSDLLQAKYDFIFKTTILDFYVGNPIRIVRE